MDMCSKKTKKFILILIIITCFSFCYPKNVNAWFEMEDVVAAPAKIFWLIERGIFTFLNNIFTNPENAAYLERQEDNGYGTSSLHVELTPENIIKGKFILFDADIFKEITDNGDYKDYVEGGAVANGKIKLRETIAGWYYALRNFTIVALLSVLVYVGIRMIISTIAQDKAKYKTMFKDWLVAICLVVVMHYMMVGILYVTSQITEALGGGKNSNMVAELSKDITGILSDEGDSNDYTYNGMDLSDAYAKIIVLGGIIVYTFIFAVKYLKREFTVIFLILLGPISCITYPIDKISDGKAQAFNKWLAEFVYQVLIQPFHLLLYIVLIGTAAELASANVIYSLVCFATMMPAEQFVKQMFGFKDSIGSPLKSFATGAVAGKAISALTSGKGGSGGKEGANSGEGEGKENQNQLPPKTVDREELNGQSDSSNVRQNDNPQLESGRSGESESSSQRETPELGDGGSEYSGSAYDGSESGGSEYGGSQNSGSENGERVAIGYAGENRLSSNGSEEEKTTGQESQTNSSGSESKREETRSEKTRNEGTDNDGEGNEGEGNEGIDNDGIESEDQRENVSSELNNGDTENNKDNESNGKEQGFLARARSNIAERAAIKYGANKEGRTKRIIKSVAKTGVKKTFKAAKGIVKAAAIGIIGAGEITRALVTGNGKEAVGIAKDIGVYAGKKALSGGKKALNKTKVAASEIRETMRKDTGKTKWYQLNSREELEYQKFMQDPVQIEKSISRYQKKHNGNKPSSEELDKEMNDRYALSRYGLNNDQIDNAIGNFQELRDIEGVSEKEALNQTVFASQLSEDYSKKDFKDEKTMRQAINSISKGFQDKGVPKEIANKNAQKYMRMAAKIKGTDIALPSTNQTVDVPASTSTISVPRALGLDESSISAHQLERVNNITLRLREQGYNDSEIVDIASSSVEPGLNSTQIINRYAVKTEFLENRGQQQHAVKMLEAQGIAVTPENIKEEMRDRLIIKERFNVRPQDISHIRKEEVKRLGQSQTKVAREFAIRNRGKLENVAHMEVERQNLINRLKLGGSSDGQAMKDAENIIALAGKYEGIQNQ